MKFPAHTSMKFPRSVKLRVGIEVSTGIPVGLQYWKLQAFYLGEASQLHVKLCYKSYDELHIKFGWHSYGVGGLQDISFCRGLVLSELMPQQSLFLIDTLSQVDRITELIHSASAYQGLEFYSFCCFRALIQPVTFQYLPVLL